MKEVTTLAEARAQWVHDLNATARDTDGEQVPVATCPCCSRPGRIYRVPLGTGPCLSLLWLVNQSDPDIEQGFVSTSGRNGAPREVVDSRSWTVLARFGLAEKETDEYGVRVRRSLWRPTPKGFAFAEGRIKVKKYAYCYEMSGPALRFEGDERYIDECCGKDEAFDFCSFMQDNYPNVDFDFDAFAE